MSQRRRIVPPKTMADIARLAGVNSSTVSRALAGSPLVTKTRRDLILRLAREHGYVINSIARNLRLQRTRVINVVIPLRYETAQAFSDPFVVQMLGHLADEITQRGYSMFLHKILQPMKDSLARLIDSKRADGLIIIGRSTEHAALAQAAANYRPMVVWGGHPDHQSYCTVGTDNVDGARVIVEHLINNGRRRIVFLGDPAVPDFKSRQEGYMYALSKVRAIPRHRTISAPMTGSAAYEAMFAYILQGGHLDAVFGATDIIALSAIRAITAAGFTVPNDVAVVGFDDIAPAAQSNPTLTTMRPDLPRAASILVNLLLRRLDGKNTPSATIQAELIVRESSAAPSN
jgi:DNA-binding LacI/PurR family transcriptional regulator